MKNMLLILIATYAAYYLYSKYLYPQSEIDKYKISNVEENPIPKDIFYSLLTKQTLETCKESTKKYNLSSLECETVINEKSEKCKLERISRTPDFINSKSLAKQYVMPYLECITPYYFCNGVEVKSESEAINKCRG